MFVGYPDHQPTDVYEFMKLNNRALVRSRNISFNSPIALKSVNNE